MTILRKFRNRVKPEVKEEVKAVPTPVENIPAKKKLFGKKK